jgi:hypothetical protein
MIRSINALIACALLLAFSQAAFARPKLERTDIDELHPTQFAVGLRYVKDKSKKIESLSKKQRERYLEEHSIPAVRGYDGQLYMIDHHHLARAVLESGHHHVFVDIIEDWSHDGLDKQQFWQRMTERGFVYLRDENNILRPVESLYENVADLADDPYRALAGEVRDEGGFLKTKVPFTEFSWANFFREHVSRKFIENNWKEAVRISLKLAKQPTANSLPGYRGRVCEDAFGGRK